MNLMKCAVLGLLVAIAYSANAAEEEKASRATPTLTSPTDDEKQQNKRLAIYGSSNTLNSGFKPITASYPSVNNYVGNPQLYTSAPSNVPSNAYSRAHYNPYLLSSVGAFRAPAHAYQHYQPLAFAASHSAPVSYNMQPLNQYAYSSIAHGPQQQFYAQHIPFNQFAYNSAQPINPMVHAAPLSSFSNAYQAPANTFYLNPQQIQKVPIYSQQPQPYQAASSYELHQPTNYHQHHQHHQQQHVKQFSASPPSQMISSKPLALETPRGPSPSSHVEHSHGAHSYAHISPIGERKPSAAPLIAAHQPQQVYYHQQPQPIYNGADFGKQLQYAAVPFASSFYPTQGGVHYGNGPYAHISKIPFAPPTSASTLIPSAASAPQKVSFH